jgi:uncharacterized protein YqgC (DUF456 family)
MDNLTPVINILIISIMLVGLLGLILPVFPGLVVIWLAALGYGISAGFGTAGWILFAIITVFMIAGSLVDNVLTLQQAHQTGASLVSILFAMLFGVLGNLVFPVLGGLVGALAALFLVEYIRRKNWREAMTATRGWAIGFGWAFVIRFLLGLMMIGLWIIWVFA